MKKSNSHIPNTPTKAIVTPAYKTSKAKVTVPDEFHVKKAKEFVEENQK